MTSELNPQSRPLLAVPAVPHGAGIRFMHPKTQYDIDQFIDVLWAILAQCNGHNISKTIIARVHKQFTGIEVETIKGIITDLISLEVLVDSRKAYQSFHRLTVNPMPFTFDRSGLPAIQPERHGLQGFDSKKVLSSKEILRILPATPDHLRTFVIITRPADIASGYYEHEPVGNKLVKLNSAIDLELLQYAFNSDTLLYGAPVIVVIAGDMESLSRQYSNRGYRIAFVDAGRAALNIREASIEVSVKSIEHDGFLDDVLAEEIGIQTEGLVPLLAVSLGHKSDQPVSDAADLLGDLRRQLVGRDKPISEPKITSGDQPWAGATFFAAAANFAAAPRSAWRPSSRRTAGGTATSSTLAQAIAVIEAYERYVSGLVRVDVEATAKKLTEGWLDPRHVVPLTSEQYNRLSFQPFTENKVWQWVRGSDIASGASRLVPVELAFYPLDNETFGRSLCYRANSSGVAAFTNEQTAVKRGLLELIERDAIMRNWFRRTSPLRIDAEKLPYHWRRRQAYWKTRGRETHVIDISDHGVVIILVVIVSDSEYPCFVAGAAASDVSFDAAVAKAFHEAEYGLLDALVSPKTRKINPKEVAGPADHGKLYNYSDNLDNLRWLWGGPMSTTLSRATATYSELIDTFRPTTVTLSPPGSPIAVVRVLSENLIPISFGYGMEHFSHKVIRHEIDPDSLKLPHYFA